MSLRFLLKKRLVENMIEDAKSKMKKKYSLIVADDATIKILHHCFKMHELNDLNVGVVVNVAYERERVRISPIYFLSPTLESVKRMIEDYSDPSNTRYAAPVHLYFCSSVDHKCMTMIKDSNVRKYLATFTELHCDFLVLERRVFTFNRDDAFNTLYNQPEQRAEELSTTAQQLVGVCLTLNEDPHIRYSSASRQSQQLAQLLDRRFAEMKSNLTKFEPNPDRATLIIFDRQDDVLTPLLHEMTYQCMVMDLLADKLPDPNAPVEVPPAKSGGDEEKKEDVIIPVQESEAAAKDTIALPDETDSVWVKYRHRFIGEVVNELPKQFLQWREQSAVVKFKDKKKGSASVTSEDMVKAARDMPQYQQQVKRFKTNIDLAKRVKTEYARLKLEDVIELEQKIATMIDDDGRKCDRVKVQTAFSNDILLDPNKPKEMKLRMFMAYLIAQGGMNADQRKLLVEKCQFNEKEQNTIMNLGGMGVVLQSNRPTEGHRNKEYWKAMQKKAAAQKESNTFIRFTSYLEWAVSNHIDGALSSDHFPWVHEPPKKSMKEKVATSYRRHRKEKPDPQTTSTDKAQRVIIYVLGGVTFTELRICYDLSTQKTKDIFVGSTSLINPKKFLELLSTKQRDDI